MEAVARLTDAHELIARDRHGRAAQRGDVAQRGGGRHAEAPLRVWDLGTVVEAVEPRTGLIRVDGRPGVILNVSRRAGWTTS